MTDLTVGTEQQYEEVPSQDKPDQTVRYWLSELDYADREEKDWRTEAKRIVERYRGEENKDSNAFNILYSNIQTVVPVMYAKTPRPDVRRRHQDKDQAADKAAEILEESLVVSLDDFDPDREMEATIIDERLTGRGVARVRYWPEVATMERDGREEGDEMGDADEEPDERLVAQRVGFESVAWDDFRMSPAKRFDQLRWMGFKHTMSREELVDQFGEIGKKIPLTQTVKVNDKKEEDEPTDAIKRATVWEFWDKDTRKIVFICPDYIHKPLDIIDPPFALKDFFPVPRPLYSLRTSDTMVPVPEFTQYEALADELDLVTERIEKLTESLKVRGLYPSSSEEIAQLIDATDDEMIPIENWQLATQVGSGGIQSMVFFFPLQEIYQAIQQLEIRRESIKNSIYEISGLSDILRGATNPNETATAQQIKGQWGSQRLQRVQREVQRFCRDLIRMMAEIIGEKYEPDILAAMTGVELPTEEEQQAAQRAITEAQQAVQRAEQLAQSGDEAMAEQAKQEMDGHSQRIEQAQEILSVPSWAAVKDVMGDDTNRAFRVDIETDSTIAIDQATEQENATKLIAGVVEFFNGIGPAVQSGYVPMDMVTAMLKMGIRPFPGSRELEDAIDMMGEQQEQQDPAAAQENQAMQLEQQKAQQDFDLRQREAEGKLVLEREKAAQELAFEREKFQMQMQLEREKFIAEIEVEREKARAEAQTSVEVEKIKAMIDAKIEGARITSDHDVAMAEATKPEVTVQPVATVPSGGTPPGQ